MKEDKESTAWKAVESAVVITALVSVCVLLKKALKAIWEPLRVRGMESKIIGVVGIILVLAMMGNIDTNKQGDPDGLIASWLLFGIYMYISALFFPKTADIEKKIIKDEDDPWSHLKN